MGEATGKALSNMRQQVPVLLQYCLKDVAVLDTAVLDDLWLLPCLDGQLAPFRTLGPASSGGRSSPTVFVLSTPEERMLLSTLGKLCLPVGYMAHDCCLVFTLQTLQKQLPFHHFLMAPYAKEQPSAVTGRMVLDEELLGASLYAQLAAVAACGTSNLTELNPATLTAVLPELMPERWQGVAMASYTTSTESPAITW